jgi:hypothetical protein
MIILQMAIRADSVKLLIAAGLSLSCALALVLGPQLGYISQCRTYLSPALLVTLNLVYGLVLGMLGLVLLRQLYHRRAELQLSARAVAAFLTGGLAAVLTAVVVSGISHHEQLFLITSLLWLFCLLAAMVGWGRIVNRVLLPDHDLDWGQQAAWGLALTVALGGLLNLTWSVSPVTVTIFLALGVAALAASARLQPPRVGEALDRALEDPIAALLVTLVVVLAVSQVAGSVAGTIDTTLQQPAFDQHDDSQAYLVMAKKMLALGSLGPEPFEARRMLSMGGQIFLQTTVLVALPVRALHLLDGGLALLILIGLVSGGARRYRLDGRTAAFLALLALSFPYLLMRGNTSSLLTGVVLLVSWFRLCSDGLIDQRPGLASAALVALTAGGLCALKSTLIPAAVVLFAASTIFHLAHSNHRRELMLEGLFTVGLIALLVMPWMISIYESSGTLLYPILGKGFYGGVYTDGFADIRGELATPLLTIGRALCKHLMRLLPVLLLLLFVRDRQPRRPAAALAIAAIVSVVLLVVMGDASASRSLSRYAYPLLMAAALGLSLTGLRQGVKEQGAGRHSQLAAVSVVVVAMLLAFHNQDRIRKMYDQLLVNTVSALAGPSLISQQEQQALVELQAAVPPGAPLLATIGHPYLLDLSRNPVSIMSLPGMASPPPGMPLDRGSEAVADYLTDRGIRYLAYGGRRDLKDLLNLTETHIRARYPRSKMRWVMLRYHQRYQQLVDQLAATRKRLYQDEQMILLDLARPVTTFVPAEQRRQISGFVDTVWTGGKGEVSNLNCPPQARYLILRTNGWRPLAGSQPLELRLTADGEELALVDSGTRHLAFALPQTPKLIRQLRIVSSLLSPQQLAAAPGQAGLGIDVQAIEISGDLEVAKLPIRSSRQVNSGSLSPAQVWHRSGFYADNGWTNGDATMESLSWQVPPGDGLLTVSLLPILGDNQDLTRLGVRLFANGVELALAEMSDHQLRFRLYDGIEEINAIRIISNTFVPKERGDSNDSRQLGVPVQQLSISAR